MRRFFLNSLLIFASLAVTLGAIEIFSRLAAGTQFGTMPTAWARRSAEVPGASSAYYWHGVLHVHDQHLMRRTTPIPPHDGSMFRIMVVGDSLTYAYGVKADDAYPVVLEKILKRRYRVEVFNMGVTGAASEDNLRILRDHIDAVRPDLVVYGICLNDLLRSNEGQKEPWLSVPEFLRWSAGLQVFVRLSNAAGRRLGLLEDFYDDLYRRLDELYPRFSADLRQMNDRTVARGLPPIVGMVLNQQPNVYRSRSLSAAVEQAARNAGMNVADTTDLYAKHGHRDLTVSRWEGHPSKEAHQIFAELLARHIQGCCGMAQH